MTPTHPKNHQPRVIDCFLQLIDQCRENHKTSTSGFREKAFRKVVDDMRRHFGDATPLSTVSQLQDRAGYGKGTLKRIDEIIQTGTLKELNNECSDERTTTASSDTQKSRSEAHKIRLDLQRITGIGPSKAKKLAAVGMSREQLAKWYHEDDQENLQKADLTHHQLLGIKYDKDLCHRIPRDVIDAFNVRLQHIRTTETEGANRRKCTTRCTTKSAGRKLSRTHSRKGPHIKLPAKMPKHDDTKANGSAAAAATFPSMITICGSYRRGNPDSGDIDVLVSDPTWMTPVHARDGLRNLLHSLEQHSLLVDDLTDRTKVTTKYMGFARMEPHPWTLRIDVRAVIRAQYAPALAYFTGSKDENVRLRQVALHHNMRLNEYGLSKLDSHQRGSLLEGREVQKCHSETISISTEEELYGALGEAYVPPEER
jgi:DNA polymerase/3'-5' exonuclease PolX